MDELEALFEVVPYMDDYAAKDLGEHFYHLAEKSKKELDKLQSDYTAAIKANAEVARLNADLQEQIAAAREAIAAAREALLIADDWIIDRNQHCGCGAEYGEIHKPNCSYLAVHKEIKEALSKLGE